MPETPIEHLREELYDKSPFKKDFSGFRTIDELKEAISPLVDQEESLVHSLARAVRLVSNQIPNSKGDSDVIFRLVVDVNELIDTYKQLCADFGVSDSGFLNPDSIEKLGDDIDEDRERVYFDSEQIDNSFDGLVGRLRANQDYLFYTISHKVRVMYDLLVFKLKNNPSPFKPTKEGHPNNLESFKRAFEIL